MDEAIVLLWYFVNERGKVCELSKVKSGALVSWSIRV